MNTPAHAILNLTLLHKKARGSAFAAIALGALAPDVFIILYYFFEKVIVGASEEIIWGTRYFESNWHLLIATGHSFPIQGSLALFSHFVLKRPVLTLFFSSVVLHSVGDLPVHHADGHAHFFPFSDWRFVSPISYWNPLHYGRSVMALEASMVLGLCIWLRKRFDAQGRKWVYAFAGLYFLGGAIAWYLWA